MRSFLVDSSVLLEALKGNCEAKRILESLNGKPKFINAIIFSEVLFILLKTLSGKSYLTLRRNTHEFEQHRDRLLKVYSYLRDNFAEVPLTEEISDIAFEFMMKHGLLPNDTLILATAKFYGLTLVTMDSDFKEPANADRVEILGVIE